MTSEAAKRAAELANGVRQETDRLFTAQDFAGNLGPVHRAYLELIQHVSDVAERVIETGKAYEESGSKLQSEEFYASAKAINALRALILPKPADPLTEVWVATLNSPNGIRNLDAFRAELAKRGGRIVFGDE